MTSMKLEEKKKKKFIKTQPLHHYVHRSDHKEEYDRVLSTRS